MKKVLLFFIVIIVIINLLSCNKKKEEFIENNNNDSEYENNDINVGTENDTSIIYEDNSESINDSVSNDSTAIGGNDICTVHNMSYHFYPTEFSDYIGNDVFYEWLNKSHINTDEEGCWPDGNVILCVEYFDIPDEIIINAYKNDYYNNNWYIKALLERDEVKFESYARESVVNGEDSKMLSEMMLKFRLFDIMATKTDEKTINYYNEITNKGANYPVCKVSISDMIINTSLTETDFTSALISASSVNGNKGERICFEYNTDLLFGDPKILTETMDKVETEPYESRVKMCDAALHIELK